MGRKGLDGREPLTVGLVDAAHDIKEGLLKGEGNRARLPAADAPAVNLGDGRQLGSRSGHKHLFGDVHLIPRKPLFKDRDISFPRELQDGISGNSFEN